MARVIGINHVALEVDDIDEALVWYARFLDVRVRSRRPGMAWIDLGDQFLVFVQASRRPSDQARHFGLVVDDKEAVRTALLATGFRVTSGGYLRFRDPSGNNIEVVDYREIQFTKTPDVLQAMGLDGIEKTRAAQADPGEPGAPPARCPLPESPGGVRLAKAASTRLRRRRTA